MQLRVHRLARRISGAAVRRCVVQRWWCLSDGGGDVRMTMLMATDEVVVECRCNKDFERLALPCLRVRAGRRRCVVRSWTGLVGWWLSLSLALSLALSPSLSLFRRLLCSAEALRAEAQREWSTTCNRTAALHAESVTGWAPG